MRQRGGAVNQKIAVGECCGLIAFGQRDNHEARNNESAKRSSVRVFALSCFRVFWLGVYPRFISLSMSGKREN
jgi:hypothetical protein